MSPTWLTAFLDSTPDHFDASTAFWQQVTGYPLSEERGDEGEFASLLPPDGDAFLKVQRLGAGEDRIHLDLHVEEPRAAADRAIELGANELTFVGIGYVVLTSPGGLHFCFVTHAAGQRPRPTTHPGGDRSRVDQVAIDCPADQYDRELAFWQEVTGWSSQPSQHYEEFRFLVPPEDQQQPLGILVQRLEDETGPVRAHLDWGCTDRPAETQRHTALGARVVSTRDRWTVMDDPTGRTYCITDGTPT